MTASHCRRDHKIPEECANREGSPFTFVIEGVPKAIEVSGGVAFANRSAGRGRGGVDLRGELAAPALVQDIAALHPCEPGPDDSQDSGPPYPAGSGMHFSAHARQWLNFVAVGNCVLIQHEPPGERALPPGRNRGGCHACCHLDHLPHVVTVSAGWLDNFTVGCQIRKGQGHLSRYQVTNERLRSPA